MHFIENISTAIDNENTFNGLCRHMAKNNFSLASKYLGDIFTKSTSNKHKLIDLTKACLLVLRAPLLYLPFVNRITQLFLRLLSPKLTKEFVGSSSFFQTVEERKIRYSVESFVSACIVCRTNLENKCQDIVKFIGKIREALDEKGKEKLNKQLVIHAVPPEGLTISFV